jgi:uncharacterized protein (TIGR02611 family)
VGAVAKRVQAGRFPVVQQVASVLQFIWRSTKRIVVVVVGAALLLGGLVMLVTPGPGLLLIIAGLAVLATEFVWAEHMLDKAKSRAASTAKRVRGRARRRPSGDTSK